MKRKTLFRWGEFTSHSGVKLPFKIDCDVLSDADIIGIANYIRSKARWTVTYSISSGGDRLAEELLKRESLSRKVIIVDDVLTTGASMEKQKAQLLKEPHNGIKEKDVIGWVIFARSKPPNWINAVFTMPEDNSR